MPKSDHLPEDIRGLTNQQAYKIGDTKGRRKADLEVLVKGIEAVGGLVAREPIGDGKQNQLPEDQQPWYKLDHTALGLAFVLTVVYEVMEYGRSEQFSISESFVWLVMFYGLVVGSKWLWRFMKNR